MPPKTNPDSQKRLIIRRLTVADHAAVVALQKECYSPGTPPWSLEQLTNHIETFSQGQLCITLDNELVATSSSLIVFEEDFASQHTYADVVPNGMLTRHDEDGDSLYGIDIVVSPRHRGMRLARRLYTARQ
jgi:ribosomal protein S18 acetylase RimI-like enzyme